MEIADARQGSLLIPTHKFFCLGQARLSHECYEDRVEDETPGKDYTRDEIHLSWYVKWFS
jgi:hypothetical protein